MNQPRKPKKVKAPEGCDLKFKNKVLTVVSVDYFEEPNGWMFNIISPKTGNKINCLQFGCAHLDSKDWIVTEWEDENN